MSAQIIEFIKNLDNDLGGNRLGTLYMLVARLKQTDQFLRQQLDNLSGQ